MSELVAMTSVSDVMTMADVVVKSGLFPMFKTRESAAAMMLLCRSKGLDPMTAIERYHVVQGRPVMRADAMLGEFLRMGGKVEWVQRDDKAAEATFSHPQGGSVTVRWTIEQARAAKLTGKDVWAQYPRQMLHARCVSEGVRSVLPGATNGLYTPDEAANMEPISNNGAIARVRAVEVPQNAIPAIEAPRPHHDEERESDANVRERALRIAMQDFASAAHDHGIAVAGPSGKPSKSRMLDAAKTILALDDQAFDGDDPASWYRAIDVMQDEGAACSDTDEEPEADTEEIADPFA